MRKSTAGLLGVCCLSLVCSYAPALAQIAVPTFDWVDLGQGTDRNTVTGLAVDRTDNIYVSGVFGASTQFGAHNLTSAGANDFFVVKYSVEKTVQWAVHGGGTNNDVAYAVAVDESGNVFVAGHFRGEMTLQNLTLLSAGGSDVFAAKLTSNGQLAWLRRLGGTADDSAFSLAVRPSGGVYVAGVETGRGLWVSYDENGDLVSSNSFSGAGEVESLVVDPSGDLLVTGRSDGMFVGRFAEDGSARWIRRDFDTACKPAAIATDAYGDCYVIGDFSGPQDGFHIVRFARVPLRLFGSSDSFLGKFSADGQLAWVKTFGGGSVDFSGGVAVDQADCVYITGGFHHGVALFDGIALTNRHYLDIYLAKYDHSGNAIWAKSAGGDGDDVGAAISVDSRGRPIVVGPFGDYAKLPETYFDDLIVTNVGRYRSFIASLDGAGAFGLSPSIAIHPEAQRCEVGATLSFNVAATGTGPLHYQWYKDGAPVLESPTLTGSQGPKLMFFGITPEDFGTYAVVVGNDFGVVTSSSALLEREHNPTASEPDLLIQQGGRVDEFHPVLALDGFGNSYMASAFYDSLELETTNLVGRGAHDVALVKRNRDGRVAWAVALATDDEEWPTSIVLDQQNNCYLCIVSHGQNWTYPFPTKLRVAKVAPDGVVVWAKTFECEGYVSPRVELGTAGLYLAGTFQRRLDLDGTVLTYESDPWWGNDATYVFLSSLNTDGDVLEAGQLNDAYNSMGLRVAVDNHGDICVLSSIFGSSSLIEKYSSSFDLMWSRFLPFWLGIIDCDASGKIYAAGASLLALDSFGTPLWTNQITTADMTFITDLKFDAVGNLYVAGAFDSAFADFEGVTLTNTGLQDIFVAKYSRDGHRIWITSLGTAGYDNAVLSVDAAANVYVAGIFGMLPPDEADPYFRFGSQSVLNQGGADNFLARIPTAAPPLSIESVDGEIHLRWSILAEDFTLFMTTQLHDGAWSRLPTEPELEGGFWRARVRFSQHPCFFTLRKTADD